MPAPEEDPACQGEKVQQLPDDQEEATLEQGRQQPVKLVEWRLQCEEEQGQRHLAGKDRCQQRSADEATSTNGKGARGCKERQDLKRRHGKDRPSRQARM